MTRKISAVAVCCSKASFSSRLNASVWLDLLVRDFLRVGRLFLRVRVFFFALAIKAPN